MLEEEMVKLVSPEPLPVNMPLAVMLATATPEEFCHSVRSAVWEAAPLTINPIVDADLA